MHRPNARVWLAIALFAISARAVPGQDGPDRPKYGPKATRLYEAREYIQKSPAPDFWALMPYYRGQETNAGCSVPAVSMLLNALKVRESRSANEPLVTPQNLLETIADPEYAKAVTDGGKGISLEELGEVVRKCLTAYGLEGHHVEAVHIEETSAAELTKLQKRLKRNEESDRDFLIANFLQSAFTGDPEGNVGHFAPVAAYDARTRRVLIFDSDRDWYEPYWVSDQTLLEGMATKDPTANRSRGYLWVHAEAHAKVEAKPHPPIMLFQGRGTADAGAAGGARTSFAILRLPDGSFAFYNRYQPFSGPLSLPDREGQTHALLPYLPKELLESEVINKSDVLNNAQAVLTPRNEVLSVFVKNEPLDREAVAKVGLPRYLNVWLNRANLNQAFEPKMIWRGYNGSQMEYQRLSNGRVLVPFGSFQPHGKPVPPWGRHKTVIQYSDDAGESWKESESQLVSPCYPGFNGSNEGACEPAIEELQDGRLWMLMRTQAGFLYESFSHDNGTTWQPARASRFNSSTGPPNILRDKNGWLVVTWNNCEMPPRHEGQGVYGGRDALHIAVSEDEGRTWRGFREIYLDHRRNDSFAKTGDRGTAYPFGSYTADGKIVILAGQGEGGRNPILIDPDWITETEAETDFTNGLSDWSVYKHHGPAKGWWQARAVGCDLVANPTDSTLKCLHVRKSDELPADGATWNFPNGWKGTLTARVMIRRGSQGAVLCLNDRFFDPSVDWGEEFAVFRLPLEDDGRIGSVKANPDTWQDVKMEWDLSVPLCRVFVNGQPAGELKPIHPTLNGLSYVRFRSTAKAMDNEGILVDRVKVSISEPYAPVCTPDDQAAHEKRYVNSIVPLWSQGG